MSQQQAIRIGIMGFGQIGRSLYDLAARSDDIEIVAIADIGRPDILHYLLCSEVDTPEAYRLEGNFLVNERFRSRLMCIDRPAEMPWDIFGVDMVIDATGKYRERAAMQQHLDNGAPRVLLRGLPLEEIDRIVIPGVNDSKIAAGDRLLSGGSATTDALCLLLTILSERFVIDCGSMTSIHAYTSDQALQDYAGSDFRRSRSAAQNIIPNTHEAGRWLGEIMPPMAGKILTSALNVPVHDGCLLDLNLVLEDDTVSVEDINDAVRDAVVRFPGVVAVAEDPIVSSDVIGSACSLLFDARGTIKAGRQTIKCLGWYENLGHAARLLDIARLYAALPLPMGEAA